LEVLAGTFAFLGEHMVAKQINPGMQITNCTFNNTTTPANEHTRDAIVALAKALEANAVAIGEAARALKGGDARMDSGIRVGDF
jgi:hypothetical protein